MKERGILFSRLMVRSILAGRKGVTRRLNRSWLNVKKGRRLYVRETWKVIGWHEGEPLLIRFKDGKRIEESDSGNCNWYSRILRQCSEDCEKAGYDLDESGFYIMKDGIIPTRWRPSIFMPRGCSRIDLDATEDARLEHLQEITEEEARLEGVEPNWVGPLDGWDEKEHGWMNYLGGEDDFPAMTALESFETLWRSLHHKTGETWDDNPELVRIAFDWRTK